MRFLFVTVMLVALPLRTHACNDTATTNEEQKTTTSVSVSQDIILSEILARPRDSDEEFIELYNKGDGDVDITNWSLQDGAGKKFTVTTESVGATTIKGKSFLVVAQSVSKLYLNNDGDSVTLFASDGTQHDSTTFPSSEEGQSWAFLNSQWQWTTSVTKGTANKLTTPEDDTKKAEEGKTTASGETSSSEKKETKETSNDIHLSELLPDPAGSDATDEWIAIENTGTASINLSNWQLTDEEEYFTFGSVTLAPHEELVVEISESHINLNNDGDSIFLIDPFATIMEGVEYTDAVEGASWARFETGWEWTTTPTPGEANVLTRPDEGGEEKDDADDEPQENVMSITSFRSLRDGEQGIVEGVVTVVPGVFGSQYFYIQDEEAGLQVYAYDKSFPDLSVGDRISVHGEKSTSRNETRIKIDVVEDIMVLDHNVQVTPADAEQLGESQEGMLIRVRGTVVEYSSSSVNIDDRVTIVLKSGANIDAGVFEEGAVVSIVGIVSQYDDTYRLMPRSDSDIVVEEAEDLELIASANAQGITTSIPPPASQPLSSLTMGMGVVILLLGSGLGVVALKYHRAKRLQSAQATLSSLSPQPPTIFDYVKKE